MLRRYIKTAKIAKAGVNLALLKMELPVLNQNLLRDSSSKKLKTMLSGESQ